MKVEEQYLQLFRENREAIDSHSPRVLNEQREKASMAFASKGLPRYGKIVPKPVQRLMFFISNLFFFFYFCLALLYL